MPFQTLGSDSIDYLHSVCCFKIQQFPFVEKMLAKCWQTSFLNELTCKQGCPCLERQGQWSLSMSWHFLVACCQTHPVLIPSETKSLQIQSVNASLCQVLWLGQGNRGSPGLCTSVWLHISPKQPMACGLSRLHLLARVHFLHSNIYYLPQQLILSWAVLGWAHIHLFIH